MKFRNYANPTDKENTVEVEYQTVTYGADVYTKRYKYRFVSSSSPEWLDAFKDLYEQAIRTGAFRNVHQVGNLIYYEIRNVKNYREFNTLEELLEYLRKGHYVEYNADKDEYELYSSTNEED